MDCLFCKIIDRTIPSNIIFEDDTLLAFNDISPQAPQHKLIIPKRHISTLNDLNENDQNLIGHMIITASTLAKDLNVAEDGYRVVFNCNTHGGQAVYHIHLHLLGGRPLMWPPG
jgi:histidine triad (HIT) family protein